MFPLYRDYGDSEFAEDISNQYIDSLRRGNNSIEATKQLIANYEDALLDEEDVSIFWCSLAETQWETGRLEETVKQNALVQIDKKIESLQTQDEENSYVAKHINALNCLKQKLLSSQPQEKKIKPYRFYYTPWQMGDIFAYRLDGEASGYPTFHDKYIYFVVKGKETWHPGHTIPTVYVYWTISDELLNLDQLPKLLYLPQFYTPTAYINHPKMNRKYALGLLCTSERIIPKRKLVYLGNIGEIEPVENEDSSAYHVTWKQFDKYMIENYMAWDKAEVPSFS